MKSYFADLFDRWVCSLLTPIEKITLFLVALAIAFLIYKLGVLVAGVLGLTGFAAVLIGFFAANLGSIAILFAIERAVRS